MIQDFTAIDLETTGLDPKRDKITEIGAVRVREGKITEHFSTLVNPGRKLTEQIISLTGLQDEELSNAPEPTEAIPQLLDFLGEDVLLGHSVLFDYSFIKRAAVNQGFMFEKEAIDTLHIARKFLPELESRGLPFLCRHYGIPHQAHRALEDAEATVRLYFILAEQFGAECSSSETDEQAQKDLFRPKQLVYGVKRESPIRKQQKERLYQLLQLHGIEPLYDVEKLTRNEASRYIDQIRGGNYS